MSELSIEGLRALYEASTPGPWTADRPAKDADGWPAGVIVAAVARGQGIYADPPGGSYPESDRRWIIAAHNAFPALLDRIADLENAIKVLETTGPANDRRFSAHRCLCRARAKAYRLRQDLLTRGKSEAQ